MAIITVKSIIENVKQSLYYFLNHETYTKGGNTKTLEGHFPGLNIIHGFPGDLEKLKLPTIAIIDGAITPYDYLTFGKGASTSLNEIVFNFTIDGFSGGHIDAGKNQRQRDRMLNDLKELLTESEFLNYYEGSNFSSVISDLEIRDVSGSYVPVTGMTESEKFRFQVDFQLVYLKES